MNPIDPNEFARVCAERDSLTKSYQHEHEDRVKAESARDQFKVMAETRKMWFDERVDTLCEIVQLLNTPDAEDGSMDWKRIPGDLKLILERLSKFEKESKEFQSAYEEQNKLRQETLHDLHRVQALAVQEVAKEEVERLTEQLLFERRTNREYVNSIKTALQQVSKERDSAQNLVADFSSEIEHLKKKVEHEKYKAQYGSPCK